MSQEPPKIQLPRARPAGLPLVLAFFVGGLVGAAVGHPVLGFLGGYVLWHAVRPRQ